MSNFNLIIIIIIISFNILIIVHPTSSAKHTPQYVHYECPSGDVTYASGSNFESNLTNTLLNILPENASVHAVSKLTAGGEGVDQVNALSYCRGDVSDSVCHDCVKAAARTVIQRCQYFKEGIIWYEECTVRYANRSNMFSVDVLEVTPNHHHYNFSGSFRYLDKDESIFNSLMNRLIDEAAYVGNGSSYATGESNLTTSNWVLRGLVQCRPDLGGGDCQKCLRQALRQRDGWNTPMLFLPSCNIRFDMYHYASTSSASQGVGGIPLKVVVPVGVACILALCGIIFVVIRHYRYRKQHPSQDYPRKYLWLKLVWATSCFSRRRILGSGGFGHVYLGTLLDGTQFAVKRLNVTGSLQGNEQFLAEVEAITNLKHRNIVSLKGYCIFFCERLLVYEYVPNQTLGHHLHGNGQEFSWVNRMNTALSLAEAFAYMHERNPAIVHRDIKPSNILMDDNFQPKVGDFGIAKRFHQDQSHITTVVRGSPGYVDPEYYKSEHLTTKSDVYAFGVVLLQLITGRKAINITAWAQPLINKAISDSIFDDLVDENLGNTYNHDEMYRMVICAATCVRVSPDERPTMRQVAKILEGSNESIEKALELKEGLMRLLWQNGSPMGQIATGDGYFQKSSEYVSFPDIESQQEFYHKASPGS